MALAGEGVGTDGILGVLKGEVLSVVKPPPDEALSLKKSPDTLTDEDRIARASSHVKNGKLDKAVNQLKLLQGKKVKKVVSGWRKDAEAKLCLDQGLNIIKLTAAQMTEEISAKS